MLSEKQQKWLDISVKIIKWSAIIIGIVIAIVASYIMKNIGSGLLLGFGAFAILLFGGTILAGVVYCIRFYFL